MGNAINGTGYGLTVLPFYAGYWGGVWSGASYSSGTGLTTFTGNFGTPVGGGALGDSVKPGMVVVPDLHRAVPLHIESVSINLLGSDTLTVKGDATGLGGSGTRFRIHQHAPYKYDLTDELRRNTPCDLGARYLWSSYRRIPWTWSRAGEDPYLAWNRVYLPEIGRWTSTDPLAAPWANLYSYTRGAAVQQLDASGLCCSHWTYDKWQDDVQEDHDVEYAPSETYVVETHHVVVDPITKRPRTTSVTKEHFTKYFKQSLKLEFDDCTATARSELVMLMKQVFLSLRRAYLDIVDAKARYAMAAAYPTSPEYVKAGIVGGRLARYFGNGAVPDAAVWDGVIENFSKTLSGITDTRVAFECECSCPGRTEAYVYTVGDSDTHLCPSFWTGSFRRQVGTIIHELTHKFADTGDHGYLYDRGRESTGYYDGSGKSTSRPGSSDLVDNADSYAGYADSYIP